MTHHGRVLAIADTPMGAGELVRQAADWAQAANANLDVSHRGTASSIVARARALHADLVVLPHPHADARYARVVQQTLHALDCPILLAAPGRSTGRVLAATDLLDPEYPALASAWELAEQRHWELTTLHCAQPWWSTPVVAPLAPFELPALPAVLPARLTSAAAGALRRAHKKVGIGDRANAIIGAVPVAETIIRSAEELDAELLVMGSHRRSFVRRLLFGSTCASVLRNIRCSVLVVRLSGEESWNSG